MKTTSKILLIVLFIFSGCYNYNKKVLQSRLISQRGYVSFIDPTLGYFGIYFPCEDSPYKTQPCYGIAEQSIKTLGYVPELGQIVEIVIYKEKTKNFK